MNYRLVPAPQIGQSSGSSRQSAAWLGLAPAGFELTLEGAQGHQVDGSLAAVGSDRSRVFARTRV
jgi:hypothetical protein